MLIKVLILFIALLFFIFGHRVMVKSIAFAFVVLLVALIWLNIGHHIMSIVLVISLIVWSIEFTYLYYATYYLGRGKNERTVKDIAWPYIYILGVVLLGGAILKMIRGELASASNLLKITDSLAFIHMNENQVVYFVIILILCLGVSVIWSMLGNQGEKR